MAGTAMIDGRHAWKCCPFCLIHPCSLKHKHPLAILLFISSAVSPEPPKLGLQLHAVLSLAQQVVSTGGLFQAVCSCKRADEHHPKPVVYLKES